MFWSQQCPIYFVLGNRIFLKNPKHSFIGPKTLKLPNFRHNHLSFSENVLHQLYSWTPYAFSTLISCQKSIIIIIIIIIIITIIIKVIIIIIIMIIITIIYNIIIIEKYQDWKGVTGDMEC